MYLENITISLSLKESKEKAGKWLTSFEIQSVICYHWDQYMETKKSENQERKEISFHEAFSNFYEIVISVTNINFHAPFWDWHCVHGKPSQTLTRSHASQRQSASLQWEDRACTRSTDPGLNPGWVISLSLSVCKCKNPTCADVTGKLEINQMKNCVILTTCLPKKLLNYIYIRHLHGHTDLKL